jgi:hypothetical protein
MCHHENVNDTRNDIKIVEIRACKRPQQRNCSITSDNIVFHYSIRFKVNKGLFLCSCDRDFGSQASNVASLPPRRNNSEKISRISLEIAKTRRTFASDLRIKRYNG